MAEEQGKIRIAEDVDRAGEPDLGAVVSATMRMYGGTILIATHPTGHQAMSSSSSVQNALPPLLQLLQVFGVSNRGAASSQSFFLSPYALVKDFAMRTSAC